MIGTAAQEHGSDLTKKRRRRGLATNDKPSIPDRYLDFAANASHRQHKLRDTAFPTRHLNQKKREAYTFFKWERYFIIKNEDTYSG